MGHFYTKIILHGLNQESLTNYLNLIGRKTYISPIINGFTIVYDRESENKSQELFQLTWQLSDKFGCNALAILVHQDIERGNITPTMKKDPDPKLTLSLVTKTGQDS